MRRTRLAAYAGMLLLGSCSSEADDVRRLCALATELETVLPDRTERASELARRWSESDPAPASRDAFVRVSLEPPMRRDAALAVWARDAGLGDEYRCAALSRLWSD